MNLKRALAQHSFLTGLAVALAMGTFTPSAHANVYASNIKINGVLTGAASVAEGSGATITYVLNEPAVLGVTVQILSNAVPVRMINIAGGSPGAMNGLNTVVWDGKNNSNAVVPPGNYSVSITARTSGYTVWTQIISNANPQVYWPSGVAVDTRTDSPYYGRVMVANGVSTANNVAPHTVGVLKFNADGSEADEGQSDAGNPFRTDGYNGDSVRSLQYGTDDRVYWEDWVTMGKIFAADMLMTTNQLILDCDASAALSSLGRGVSGLDITDPGTTNALIWVCDASDYPSIGTWAFPLTNNGVADSVNGGINVLATGPNIPLVQGPGIMVSAGGDIYIGEVRNNAGDPTPRAISITNVWPSAVHGSPTNWWNGTESYPITGTRLRWAVGQNDDTFRYGTSVAIDSRTNPKCVSISMNGGSGGCRVLNAARGTLVTNINQTGSAFYLGTGWDNVGNLYLGNAAHSWEAWSPPGSNQASTPAVVTLIVTALVPLPHITGISVSGGTVTIKFTGDSTLPATAFTVHSSAAVNGSYTDAGATVTGSAGSYTATVAVNGNVRFYRIKQ